MTARKRRAHMGGGPIGRAAEQARATAATAAGARVDAIVDAEAGLAACHALTVAYDSMSLLLLAIVPALTGCASDDGGVRRQHGRAGSPRDGRSTMRRCSRRRATPAARMAAQYGTVDVDRRRAASRGPDHRLGHGRRTRKQKRSFECDFGVEDHRVQAAADQLRQQLTRGRAQRRRVFQIFVERLRLTREPACGQRSHHRQRGDPVGRLDWSTRHRQSTSPAKASTVNRGRIVVRGRAPVPTSACGSSRIWPSSGRNDRAARASSRTML